MKDMYSNLRKKDTSYKKKRDFLKSMENMKMVSFPVINNSFTSPLNDIDLNIAISVFGAVIQEALIQKALKAQEEHNKNKFLNFLQEISKIKIKLEK